MGGRVQSFPCNDSFVEIGAQWIHGQDDNIAYELAKEYQLLADYTSAEGEGKTVITIAFKCKVN